MTLFFSCAAPNLATVIPAMDHINEKLTNDSINHTKYKASIWASLNLAKKTLNCYCNMMDSSEVYRIAMGMFLILLYMFYRYLILIQYFTLGTSTYISSKWGGRPNGSILPRTLFAPSLNGHMQSIIMLKMRILTKMSLWWCVLLHSSIFFTECLCHYRSPKITSTTSPHSLHLGDQSFVTNWMLFLVLTPKMLLM